MQTPLPRIEQREWDAIVVGAGAAGGLAALLLARAGLDVLVLDAGWTEGFWRAPFRTTLAAAVRITHPNHLVDHFAAPAVALCRKAFTTLGRIRQPVQMKCLAWTDGPDLFVDDRDAPYVTAPDAPFHWFRVLQIGGRMATPSHGRQYYRMCPDDFLPAEDRPGWPLRCEDLAPWYAQVEALLALSGQHDRLRSLPDSVLTHERVYTAVDDDLVQRLRSRWPALEAVLSRFAPPLPAVDRASESQTLFCRRGAVVRDIKTDLDGHVGGVLWFDRETSSLRSGRSRLVFLAASALESARILMMSRSVRHPDGLGARSGVLGKCLMDHLAVAGSGVGPPIDAPVGRPSPGHCIYVPRMDRRDPTRRDELRPYGMQIYRWAATPRRSELRVVSFSTMAPRQENRIMLHDRIRDAFGAPVLEIECRLSRDEITTTQRQSRAIAELAAACGVELTRHDSTPPVPGAAIHECGVARMGSSPDSSVLDPFNQCWDAQGLYLTDAASFPSEPLPNPTLTSMALTARAVDHALHAHA